MTDPFRTLDSGLRYWGQKDALEENRRQFDETQKLEHQRFGLFRERTAAEIGNFEADTAHKEALTAEVAPNAAAQRGLHDAQAEHAIAQAEHAIAQAEGLRGIEGRAADTYRRGNDASDIGQLVRMVTGGADVSEWDPAARTILRERQDFSAEEIAAMSSEEAYTAALASSSVPVESNTRMSEALTHAAGLAQNKNKGIGATRGYSFSANGMDDPVPQDVTPAQFREMVQAETNNAAAKITAFVDGKYGGDLNAAAKDPDFKQYLVGIIEAHPEINKAFGNRRLVDEKNPTFSMRELATSGAMGSFVPVIKNVHGKDAPITAGGAPYDPGYVGDQGVLAFTPTEMAQAIVSASTTNGGSIDLLGPMVDSAEAATMSSVAQNSPEDHARLIRTLNTLQEDPAFTAEKAVGLVQGDAFSEAAKAAEKQEIQEGAASARNAPTRARDGMRTEEMQAKRQENLINVASTNMMNRLGEKAGKALGAFDQEFETYRATDAELSAEPGVTAEQIFRRKMQADVRDTLANPANVRLLHERMGLPEDVTRWGPNHYNRALEVIVATRRSDTLNRWWQKDTDTRGQISAEAIDAVLSGENQGQIAFRKPWE